MEAAAADERSKKKRKKKNRAKKGNLSLAIDAGSLQHESDDNSSFRTCPSGLVQ